MNNCRMGLADFEFDHTPKRSRKRRKDHQISLDFQVQVRLRKIRL